jgi:predicted dienelactone hydrolase
MRIGAFSLVVPFLFARSSFGAVGFQQVTVPDPHGKPIACGIWYPSLALPALNPLGVFTQSVAIDGKVSGKHLPLVLISHGTGGSMASHYDTAIALAEAGFVVTALTHTGDNYMDQRYVGNRQDLIDRPRQLKLVLNWVLSAWAYHDNLDSRRVGLFGFSLGGFTGLVEIGGTPELARMAQLCATQPDAPECVFVKQRHGDQLDPVADKPTWVHDARIRVAVIAAPAVSFLFGPGDLRMVRVPVQLWRAEHDTQAPDPWNSAILRQELPHLAEEHIVPGVDHFVFLAPCSDTLAAATPGICRDARGFDRSAFHRDFNQSVIRFLRTELKSD